jgi:integrase
MARTIRDTKLDSRSARDKLDFDKLYWRSLDPQLALGYRRGSKGGRWVWRCYVGKGRYHTERIGTADDFADSDSVTVLSYGEAQHAARGMHSRWKRRQRGLPEIRKIGPYTVRDCLSDYYDYLETEKKSADYVKIKMNAVVGPIENIDCDHLIQRAIIDWRKDISRTMPKLPGGKLRLENNYDWKDPENIRKRKASANNAFLFLRAALNRSWREGIITSNEAWCRIEMFGETLKARARFLTHAECHRLLVAASRDDLRKLLKAGLHTGARKGELAALQCADFNSDVGNLHISKSKGGRERDIWLTPEAVQFFTKITAGRAGDEVMLLQNSGNTWGKGKYYLQLTKAALKRAGIKNANFHTMRHTYASLSVMNGMPLIVVAKTLGHTTTKMVELHYGHLAKDYVADQVRAAAPQFGFDDGENVSMAA